MLEQIPAQVPAQVHLNVHGLPGGGDDQNALRQNGGQIGRGEGDQPLQGPRLNEMGHGVQLEQGQGRVQQVGKAGEHDHLQVAPLEPGQDGKQPLPDGPVKGLGIFFFVKGGHYASPPFSTRARSSLLIWMS